jgi:GTP pyrophosphokinase
MASSPSSPIDVDPIASGAVPPLPEGVPVPAGAPGSGHLVDPVDPVDPVERALALALARVGSLIGGSGEAIFGHARGTLAILDALRVDGPTRLAAVLFGLGDKMPLDEVEREFGDEVRTLVEGMRQLLRLKDRTLKAKGTSTGVELETLRRMTLAMASDIRVVLLRLASRLQSLRHHAETRQPPEPAVAYETLEVLAPLANRLGLGQLKWELEDLAFRFIEPDLYKSIARQLEERRFEREAFVRAAVERLRAELAAQDIEAEVTGRPKHIHSIYNKMRTKGLSFEEVQDLRAFRVMVGTLRDCYAVLGIVHQIWVPTPREFDDYISRPKANGYQSLHTVVTADDGRPLEIQIRTRAMHQHAEFGIASHWRYKEASTQSSGSPPSAARGAKTPSLGRPGEPASSGAVGAQDERVEWMRQLLMWQQEVGATLGGKVATSADGEAERIYLLTPEARVVELPAGSTPVDFAYHVHTVLGHRCRGARVDGQLVPLHTPLRNGQTVEIVAARSAIGSEGPSRDWLNPQLGFVRSPRARAKVRQWFNALELERDLSAGREKVGRILQREGRTALALDELARRMGFERPDDLFLAAAREEVGPRMLEEAIRAPADAGRGAGEAGRGVARGPAHAEGGAAAAPELPAQRALRGGRGTDAGGVLVVGVDFLMTQLARCCRPAPPDPIVGFVTRGHGVSVHRSECRSFAELARRAPERVLETGWGDWEREPVTGKGGLRHSYPVDVVLRARDRQGLLRDVSDVFARDRLNVTAVQTLSRGGVAQMQFTVEVPGIPQLKKMLVAVRDVDGVIECRRK